MVRPQFALPAGQRFSEQRLGLGEPSTVAVKSGQIVHGVEGIKVIDALEDCDDVQNVYANFDVSDEVMALVEA